MGFDVIHMNLHKTFSTPHGGGGPGAGPVGVSERLRPYLPVPMVGKKDDQFVLLDENDCPQSIGRMSAFAGNAGVLLRAYIYAKMLGREGMSRVADFATLNANYLMKRLIAVGYDAAYPERRATHEFILTLKKQAKELNVTAMDVAKRLLDYEYHAPTTYFPMLIAECLLIEPTETEAKETLDGFIDAMAKILDEAKADGAMLKQAPYTLPVRRLDDVKAVKQLDVVWATEGK
jgi:glycine dehydrogenase subunit 2